MITYQLIGQAIARAKAYEAREEHIAVALISGLRRLRATLDSTAGYTAVCRFDDAVRAVLLWARLPRGGVGGAPAGHLRLPAPDGSRGCAVAATLIGDAIETGLSLDPVAFVGMIDEVIQLLVHLLIEQLGGPRDPDELLAAIQPAEAGAAPGMESRGPTVVRLH